MIQAGIPGSSPPIFYQKRCPPNVLLHFSEKSLISWLRIEICPSSDIYIPKSWIFLFMNIAPKKFVLQCRFPPLRGAAGTIEELHAMGCDQFIVCGGAGSIKRHSEVGEIIVPTAAVRDEGTSYHYLKPSREVECHKEALDFVTSGLEKLEIPYTTGKTWTTDAMYRETPEMIELRRNEGCLTVEMEAAAFFAVSKYYDIPLAQLLYVGDDVSGEKWAARNWNNQKSVRSNLLFTAIKLMEA